jgi:folate-binding Fe-S cluster repair protein YgfZ
MLTLMGELTPSDGKSLYGLMNKQNKNKTIIYLNKYVFLSSHENKI